VTTRSESVRAELERDLAELWSAKLGRSPIGLHDNFFELGGDSLLAADLLMDVYVKLNYEVDAWVLFTKPTVAELAEVILTESAATAE
jgi:acyl carrier protein